jgi:positive regulator of sigma E activity
MWSIKAPVSCGTAAVASSCMARSFCGESSEQDELAFDLPIKPQ